MGRGAACGGGGAVSETMSCTLVRVRLSFTVVLRGQPRGAHGGRIIPCSVLLQALVQSVGMGRSEGGRCDFMRGLPEPAAGSATARVQEQERRWSTGVWRVGELDVGLHRGGARFEQRSPA